MGTWLSVWNGYFLVVWNGYLVVRVEWVLGCPCGMGTWLSVWNGYLVVRVELVLGPVRAKLRVISRSQQVPAPERVYNITVLTLPTTDSSLFTSRALCTSRFSRPSRQQMPLSVKRYLIIARIPHGQITDSSPAVTGVSRAIYQELKAGRGWRGKKKKKRENLRGLKASVLSRNSWVRGRPRS